jgi:hypothetical protein
LPAIVSMVSTMVRYSGPATVFRCMLQHLCANYRNLPEFRDAHFASGTTSRTPRGPEEIRPVNTAPSTEVASCVTFECYEVARE